jgi:2-methylcitrate dehydratase
MRDRSRWSWRSAGASRSFLQATAAKSLEDEMAVANAHPLGAKPFGRADYIRKFETLTEGLVSVEESKRFLALVQRLPHLTAAEIEELNVVLPPEKLTCATRDKRGIF